MSKKNIQLIASAILLPFAIFLSGIVVPIFETVLSFVLDRTDIANIEYLVALPYFFGLSFWILKYLEMPFKFKLLTFLIFTFICIPLSAFAFLYTAMALSGVHP